jgi:hypothetical protein
VKRSRLAIVAALAAAVVAGSEAADAAGPGDALSFRASVTPRTHLFGDPVTAEVQAVAPTEAATGMTIKTDFAPYVIVGPVEVTRAPAGAQTEVRWRWHLECLTRACLPGETQRRVVFGPAKITVPVDGKNELATATWPIVIVRSRLGPEDRARPEQRASIYPVGDPTQRIGATTLERILWVAAIVVALAAFALMLPFVRRIPRPRRGFERLGSAQRALVLARRAASRDDPSRRRTALERLGRELGRSGSPELADEATRLAWAESPPASDAMTGLVGRAEHELGGRR